MTLAVHPEAVPGRPEELRWVIPPGTLAVRGPVTSAPGELGRLLAGQAVSSVVVEPGAVRVALPSGATWREAGARVRGALLDSLAHPADWRADGPAVEGRTPAVGAPGHGADAALARAAADLLDGPTGDYVRSHGGRIELAGVHDGVVDVRLAGACEHCPAASATLRARVETDLRAGVPGLVGVRRVDATEPAGPWWRTIRRR